MNEHPVLAAARNQDSDATIVPSASLSHKYYRCRALLLLAAISTGLVADAAAQQRDTPAVSTPQLVSIGSATALYGVSLVLDRSAGPPSCVPCDRADVPAFDRWVIRPVQPSISSLSDVLVLSLAGGTLGHTWSGDDGPRRTIASLEAVAWTVGITELSKAIIGRPRPVMYTVAAAAAADNLDNQRSMPSGHASVAFALATSYWLNNPEKSLVLKLVAMAGAGAVGVLRVAAAKHFPSDVVVGALVGTGSAFIIHGIRF